MSAATELVSELKRWNEAFGEGGKRKQAALPYLM